MGRKEDSMRFVVALVTALTFAAVAVPAQTAPPSPQAASARQAPAPTPAELGVLAPANLAKPRPKPPFDITGTWFVDLGFPGSWRFGPPYPKLTPAAQVHFDASRKAQAEGKVYRDDIGQCWPAGVPLIMTRVWSISMVQLPTVAYMISGFMNSLRIINLDGRSHVDPDLLVRTHNGDSVGHWEADALVIDTTGFTGDHHWIDSGIPASDALHIVERVKLVANGTKMQIEYTLTDPKSWEGEWKVTKQWNRVDARDMEIAEVECLPDLNSHIPSTQSKQNVR
jgi:hypothetical protein